MQRLVFKSGLALCCLVNLFSVPVFGQRRDTLVRQIKQNDTVLNEVVISGSARRSAFKESAPVQIMDKGRMEKLGMKELYEAIRTFSGVSIKDYGGIGGVKAVSIRSLGTQHTAVCYDGVTVSNVQSGQIDIGRFSLDNIDEVSLVIGQGDEIFQTARSFASSGVVNIKTVSPKFDNGNVNVGVQLKGGSFGLFNPAINFDGKLSENWAVSVTGDWMRADGEYPYTLTNGSLVTEEKRKNTDVNIWRTELNLYGKVGKSGKILLKGNYLASERGLPGSVVLYNDNSNERLGIKQDLCRVDIVMLLMKNGLLRGT